MLLSIIVPVYQVEDYLETCIKSMLDCHGFSYEIILVTKPSDDKSERIACKLQEENNDKIKIINQDKDGLSNARNAGLKCAKGEYVAFFDSDDYIDANVFSELIKKIEKKDNIETVISDYCIVGNSRNISMIDTIEGDESICNSDYLSTFLKKRRNYWNAWQYVLKRNFLLENNLFFLEGVHSEDIEFATRVILNSSNFAFFGKPYYYYRIGREGSLANKVTLKHIVDLMNILEISMNMVKEESADFKKYLQDKLILQYILSFVMIYDVKKGERKRAIEIIEEKKDVYTGNVQSITKKIFMRLGVLNGARILKVIRVIRRIVLKIH